MKKVLPLVFLLLLAGGVFAENSEKQRIKELEKRVESLERQLMAQKIEIYLNRLRIKQADTLTNRNVNVILENYKRVDKLDTAYRELGRLKKKINSIYSRFLKEENIEKSRKLYERAGKIYAGHLRFSVVKGFNSFEKP